MGMDRGPQRGSRNREVRGGVRTKADRDRRHPYARHGRSNDYRGHLQTGPHCSQAAGEGGTLERRAGVLVQWTQTLRPVPPDGIPDERTIIVGRTLAGLLATNWYSDELYAQCGRSSFWRCSTTAGLNTRLAAGDILSSDWPIEARLQSSA